MLTFDDLVSGFRVLGLKPGDTALVHCAYKPLGGVEGGADTVVDALQAAVGPEGTILFPTFTLSFCRGVPFHAGNSPSEMGVITEAARRRPEARRVVHPIYSFAALGRRADEVAALRYQSSFGADSAFAWLREVGGKIVLLGVDFEFCMTFFHHVEELEGCDYRFPKEFDGSVTDLAGQLLQGPWVMNVRNLNTGVVTQVAPMGRRLEELGLVTVNRIGGATVKCMDAAAVYEATAREMKKDPGLLHERAPGEM